MSFIIGKLSRKISKQHKEYFVGKIGVEPVRAAWAKNGKDEICIFLDMEKLNFLSQQNESKRQPAAEEANKQQ